MATHNVLLVGAHGYGSVHLDNLARLSDRIALVAVADPTGGPSSGFGATAPAFADLDSAFAAGVCPDVVIIATPTGAHFSLAMTALSHGCDVYVEKPPVASMAQFDELLAAQRRTGRAVQVGFQSFGSLALDALAGLGPAASVATWASWTRDAAYWSRSAWAGRREIDGAPIVDGVLTNPLSHAIATALRIADARRREDVARVELELYRANDIEADDTSSVRITLADGRTVSAALTLAAPAQTEPVIEVRTADTDVRFLYTEDVLIPSEGARVTTGRIDLFEQLLDHRERGVALSSPLVESGAFMTVLEAVRTAPAPTPVPRDLLRVLTDGPSPITTVDGIDFWVERTARSAALFSELRAPFATVPPGGVQHELRIGDDLVAVLDDGSTVAAASGPRPFLHPVRTPGGVTVTAAHPIDHDWHLGVSVAVQHANRVNFWGGQTYTRDHGYRWLDDHGRIRLTAFTRTPDGFTHDAEWISPSGDVVLAESTSWTFSSSGDARATSFSTTTVLRAGAHDVELGSPGSHGREGGGYGGFFWRLADAQEATVRTPLGSGEGVVHGSVAPWVAFAGRFAEGEATVVLAPDDERTAADPWFVRVSGYPGLCSALAWDSALPVPAGSAVTVSLRGLVSDGRLSDHEIERLLTPRRD